MGSFFLADQGAFQTSPMLEWAFQSAPYYCYGWDTLAYLRYDLLNEHAPLVLPRMREWEVSYQPAFHELSIARWGWNIYLHILPTYRIHMTRTADTDASRVSLKEWEAEWRRVVNITPESANGFGARHFAIALLDLGMMERCLTTLPVIDENFQGGYVMEKGGKRVMFAPPGSGPLWNRIQRARFLPHLVSCMNYSTLDN